MSDRSRRQFAETVRREPVNLAAACHLLAAEADASADAQDPAVTFDLLDALAARARPRLAARAGAAPHVPRVEHGSSTGPQPAVGPAAQAGDGGDPLGRLGEARRFGSLTPRSAAEALHEALGLDAGFGGSEEDYTDLRSSLLPDVLRRRRGLPILLSVVWLEVARRLGVAAYPVGLPGHVVVAVGTPEDNVLVDPYDAGRLLTIHDAAAKVRAAGAAFNRGHLAPMEPHDVLARILGNVRVLGARTDAPRTRLWAVELSLLLPHHPTNLRRERGELRVRLGDFLGGARDLTTFADTVTAVEPTAAAAARQAAAAARARLN